jgi:hypothetical protein
MARCEAGMSSDIVCYAVARVLHCLWHALESLFALHIMDNLLTHELAFETGLGSVIFGSILSDSIRTPSP